ncbi:superoxide dismutase family protein [Yersinia ruckeri]|uniref:superoxide dismutase family protein n=1 Tax=Yersinia ruckeri TaxID=29486 RepID=UPI0008FDDC5E|nr:superoxide dismutase family protein [Yersinia ruckeri]OJB91664.1 superoxide dismutase [Yersinia ruckeri]OJB96445.1 superoxide dismutase [Yersinia ruckeri]OJB99491.1 superoxide dismutase [Yersinia ruckeri]
MKRIIIVLSAFFCTSALAESANVTMNIVTSQGIEGSAGTIVVRESNNGLEFLPSLKGLSPGMHGFHVHENGSCEPALKGGKSIAAGAAGGHFDPDKTGRHEGPYGNGHLGDLPALHVNADGRAMDMISASRLKKLAEVKGKALMIHVGGDNMSDHPEPLGGGGGRYICGIIK